MNKLETILNNTNGATIARIGYTTRVKTAAKHIGVLIEKNTIASVLLFGKVNAYNSAYQRRVIKTASAIAGNDLNAVQNFEVSSNWHSQKNDAYSIRTNSDKSKDYLMAMFCQSSKSSYTINGNAASKEDVLQYLTPSEVKKMTGDSTVYNKKNNVTHAAIVRTIALENIDFIKIRGAYLTK